MLVDRARSDQVALLNKHGAPAQCIPAVDSIRIRSQSLHPRDNRSLCPPTGRLANRDHIEAEAPPGQPELPSLAQLGAVVPHPSACRHHLHSLGK